MSDSPLARHGRLVLVPAVITLAVTLLRLVGELQNWSSTLFNREAGGGGALIGIVWLVPIFGVYFALRLAREGEGPGKVLRGGVPGAYKGRGRLDRDAESGGKRPGKLVGLLFFFPRSGCLDLFSKGLLGSKLPFLGTL